MTAAGMLVPHAIDLFGGLDLGEAIYIVLIGSIGLLFTVSLVSEYWGRGSQALRHAATWIAILLALLTGYAFREELGVAAERVAMELTPAGRPFDIVAGEEGQRSVKLRKRLNGQFQVSGEVNGAGTNMLVDTGATTVVLKTADAELAGIDISSLAFTVPVQTANGQTFAASVRLRTVSIGPIVVRDVEALVAKPGNLSESLLGMSFLTRLRSYEFSGDFLTLRG